MSRRGGPRTEVFGGVRTKKIGAAEEEEAARRRHRQQVGGAGFGMGVIGAGVAVILVVTIVGLGYIVHIDSHTNDIHKTHHSKQDVGFDCVKVEFSSHGGYVVVFKGNGASCDAICYDDEEGYCSTEFDGCHSCTHCISEAKNCSGLCQYASDCREIKLRPSLAQEVTGYGDDDDFDIEFQCLGGICIGQLDPQLAEAIYFPEHTSQHLDDEFCEGLLDRNDSYSHGCILSGAVYIDDCPPCNSCCEKRDTKAISLRNGCPECNSCCYKKSEQEQEKEEERDGSDPHHTEFHNCKYVAECAIHRREPMASPASRCDIFSVLLWAFDFLRVFFAV